MNTAPVPEGAPQRSAQHEGTPEAANRLPVLQGDFVLLRAGTMRLVLPQRDVGPVEYLVAPPVAGAEPGWLRAPGDASGRRYAALSGRLRRLPACPPERFIVVTLAGRDADGTGWCWDELKVMIGARLQPRPLSAVLADADSPMQAYVEIDGRPAFLCSAEGLRRSAQGAEVEP